MKAELSPWDSEVFEMPVGRIRTVSPPDASLIRANNRGLFDVVFVTCRGWHEPAGGVAVDYRYDMEAKSLPMLKGLVPMGRPQDAQMPGILDLAGRAFEDSRFLRDPKLSHKAAAVYKRWCSDAHAGGGLLAPADGPVAFLAYGIEKDKSAWRIELIAVERRSRGRGIGREMVELVARELGMGVRVAVSARNHQALRTYESWGFLVRSVSTAWHVWI